MIFRIALALLITISTHALAQQSQIPRPQAPRVNVESGAAWPENYVLSLTGKDGEKSLADITIMLAGPQFNATAASADSRKEPTVGFGGTATREADGGLVIQYGLSVELAIVTPTTTGIAPVTNENVQYKTSNAQSTVRLKPGEAAEILRTGTKVWRLALDRVAAQKEE